MRELGGVMRNAHKAFGLLLAADRGLAIQIVVLTLFDAVLPVAIAYVGKRIIDGVVAAVGSGAGTAVPLLWVGAEALLMLAKSSVSELTSAAQTRLRSALGLEVNTRILAKAINVSYRHFEDPHFNDQLAQARREASSRPLDAVRQLLVLARNAVTLAGYGALLAGFSGFALLALLGSTVPPFIAEARFGRRAFLLQRSRIFDTRQANYLEALLSKEESAKEVKLFSLSDLLLRRYRAAFERFHAEDSALARGRARSAVMLGGLSVGTLYLCYAWVVVHAAAGEMSVGSMALYLVALREGQGAFQAGLLAIARLYEDNLFMSNLFEYLAVPEDEPHEPIPLPGAAAASTGEGGSNGDEGLPAALAAPPCIELDRVSFRYPAASRDSLVEVSLRIEPGETLALVGPNGAGKTTLVKLLTGLYAPSAGVIRMDGVDITTLSPAVLRSRIGVIFQDFVRFHFTVADNIGVGWLPEMANRDQIERAAAAGGVEEIVAGLPGGYAQSLGRWFGGEDLSTGQWQRLALSRAFMRRSPVLVLDEPTAALDAEAEAEIFGRFRALARGRTAILITHRFSTVRMADRIAVFEAGRLTECGTHAELLAADGRYARMFRIQAAGYSLS
jgi:ATP-binding cassette subfamily B protein